MKYSSEGINTWAFQIHFEASCNAKMHKGITPAMNIFSMHVDIANEELLQSFSVIYRTILLHKENKQTKSQSSPCQNGDWKIIRSNLMKGKINLDDII